MPIARDATTGKDETVDKEILAAARNRVPEGLRERAAGGSTTPSTQSGFQDYDAPAVRKDANDAPWMAQIRAEMLARTQAAGLAPWQGPIALPVSDKWDEDADISGGRVRQAPRMYGPFPKPGPTLDIAGSGPAPGLGPQALWKLQQWWADQGAIKRASTPEARAEMDAAFEAELRKNGIDPSTGQTQGVRGIADLGPGLPATKQQTEKALQAAEEVGMMAGATTTVPEVERKSTGVPAWDNRIEEAIAGRAAPDRSTYATTYRDRELAAEQQIAEMAKQQEVENRTGRKAMGSKPGGEKELDVLSYRELDQDQKAAVDFNTLLSKATGRDKKTSRTDVQPTAEYNSAARQVVGDAIGPIQFAPETINLLGSIGVKTGDVSLDDFLKLKIAVNADDLRGFKLEDAGGPDASLATPERKRTLLQREVVEAFRNTQRDQAAGGSLLNVQRDLLGTESQLGFGTANMDAEAPMEQQLNAYFQNSLYDMARKDAPEQRTKEVMAEAKGLLNDEEFKAFINFLDVRTREAMQYRRPIGEGVLDPSTGEPLEFQLARDFRKQIGF